MKLLALTLVVVFGLLTGCKVTTPGRLESGVASRAKHWILVRNKSAKNPVPLTHDNLANGKDAFSHYCFVCHGLDGQNTGVPFAASMSPPVPSLADPDIQSYTDGQLKWVIENGIRPAGMPASRGILTDEEMWSIVLYIRHLPPAGSLGEPPIYSGEVQQNCEPAEQTSSHSVTARGKERTK
jgi:mono/diheme cytochrome c family protein